MDYMRDILTRAHIQQVCAFLLYGTEKSKIDLRSYEDRLDEPQEAFSAALRTNITDEARFDELLSLSIGCNGAYQDVYFELGILAALGLAQSVWL